MKKLFLGALLLLSIVSFGQIKEIEIRKPITIGVAKYGDVWKADLSNYVEDNLCVLNYLNTKYSTITDIKTVSFKATPTELEKLYQILKTQIIAEKSTEKNLELGDYHLLII